ncbi:MAG: tyrosine--tRNA ligase [Mesotoga sp.]|uniref:tyrosine--tRNA ligase n=1 Tax=Mesotoga sp. TaxID=2053577 RepID=UPI0016B9F77F|nr:tyrosine--tRNA ligase [Mesotoga sp.]MDI9367388.1 tyrosine--tRNA ligase [Thermotogota bacterium]NLT45638.1 tyrosine--tRNA ligase [Thermotogaceae bacterium]MDD2333521.1 tyrosine--tRNA ligase [Mesotoga sp.]MDD4206686.1 tyrosine--tRNA ligase [Mesotoga sp.]MDD4826503.1 tyrosine--tRNA ligase [Mesotoga sp.]
MGPEEQLKELSKNHVSLISEEELLEKLKKKCSLRVKLGVDPSRPDLHLGHAVVLRKLRLFQEFGHQVVLIIGDFTARIGDPSGRSKTRPMLSREEAKANAESYSNQAFKILNRDLTEIRFNSEWLDAMSFEDVIRLSSKYTVARMLERHDFARRYSENEPIGVSEFLYPLAQAYDSVVVKADVEIGGDDQFFNLVVGRKIQEEYGLEAQAILTVPLIEGTDGKLKMSKSYDNYIAFEDSPRDMFGKVMSIPDSLMMKYFRLLTDKSDAELAEYDRELLNKAVNPRDIKLALGVEITSQFYGREIALNAEREFVNIFRNKELPEEMPEIKLPAESISIVDLLVSHANISSRSEARRLIDQGGVRVNDEVLDDIHSVLDVSDGDVLRIGKKRFYRLVKC